MSRHISPEFFYKLPSGAQVHPNRLLVKDGTLMWKHAFLNNNEFTSLPSELAHEQHIIKTAQRIEELNAWVSHSLDPWECLRPVQWYNPRRKGFSEGIAVQFVHTSLSANEIYDTLLSHKHEYEYLACDSGLFTFYRC